MTITVISAGPDAVQATVNGAEATIPRALRNAEYQRLLAWGMKKIELTRGVYNAFPSAIFKSGGALAAIFSSGEGHGVSHRQIAIRSDNNFATFARSVFFENASGVYDNSFLDGMLTTGQTANFKTVFTVEKTADGYANSVQSTVSYNGATYALWHARITATGGKWYCTGYRTNPLPTQAALFESSDGGKTWAFAATIAAAADKSFSETAVVKALNGDLMAVIREDSGAGRPLYISRSTTGIAAWSAPTLLTGMEGTQPCLLLLANGDILLLTGDRTGRSGLDPAGNMIGELNITGISCWRSTDHGVTWSNQVMLAPMWSTDGGQPMAVELDNGLVGVLCYLAPGATSGDVGVEPGIYWITFNPSAIV